MHAWGPRTSGPGTRTRRRWAPPFGGKPCPPRFLLGLLLAFGLGDRHQGEGLGLGRARCVLDLFQGGAHPLARVQHRVSLRCKGSCFVLARAVGLLGAGECVHSMPVGLLGVGQGCPGALGGVAGHLAVFQPGFGCQLGNLGDRRR